MISKGFRVWICIVLWTTVAMAGDYCIFGTTDKNPLTYAPGEEMTFSLQVLLDGQPVDGIRVQWVRTGDDGETEQGEAVSKAQEPIQVKTSTKTAGFVYLLAKAVDADAKPIPRNPVMSYSPNVEFYGGAGVLVHEIHGAEEPKDFDAFWARQKERLSAVPMEVERVPVESPDPNILCWDVKIKCLGKPVSGYLCIPKDAAAGSLPIRVSYHGYGCYSANRPLGDGKEAIALDVNAHGIPNGQPAEFYQNLSQKELAGYAFHKDQNEDPETAYFNGMMLRVIRSLEFVKSLPEWNGKDLRVSGGSQGGFQALSAAGLDSDVTECHAGVAWCLDLSGPVKNHRLSGWRPEWTEALGYYDPVYHAKRYHGKTSLYAGLGDYVSPPSGQMALYNNLTGPKKLTWNQGCSHGYHLPGCAQYILEK